MSIIHSIFKIDYAASRPLQLAAGSGSCSRPEAGATGAEDQGVVILR